MPFARAIPIVAVVAALLGCTTPAVEGGAQTAAADGTPVAGAAVIPGIEVLLRDSLHLIRGKRVGLITNHSGRDRQGVSSADLLARAEGVRLTALFGPEHGIRGIVREGEKVDDMIDSATGVRVYSLYGATRVPTPEMLNEVDVLLYDIQDVGARVYTYVWTMALSAEAAGKAGKPFVVLDRPNPIRADRIEGGVLDPQYRTFVGQYPVAMRYGLTPGELLRYLVGSGQVAADITVVPMENYRRDMWWDETGLEWINPSPNLRNLDATLLYPGTVLFEATNATEGRGTDDPFAQIGASWMTGIDAIIADLESKQLPGVRFERITRTVQGAAKFDGETIPMIRLVVTDREAVRPFTIGVHLLRAIYKQHPDDLVLTAGLERLAGTGELRTAVTREGGVEALLEKLEAETVPFRAAVAPYRIYE